MALEWVVRQVEIDEVGGSGPKTWAEGALGARLHWTITYRVISTYVINTHDSLPLPAGPSLSSSRILLRVVHSPPATHSARAQGAGGAVTAALHAGRCRAARPWAVLFARKPKKAGAFSDGSPLVSTHRRGPCVHPRKQPAWWRVARSSQLCGGPPIHR